MVMEKDEDFSTKMREKPLLSWEFYFQFQVLLVVLNNKNSQVGTTTRMSK